MKAWVSERFQTSKSFFDKTKRQVIRWRNGQRFPPGFDEWAKQPTPSDRRNNLRFSDYTPLGQPVEPSHAVKEFVNSVTKAESYWLNIDLTSPGFHYGEWNLRFRSVSTRLDKQMSAETTDVWWLSISGYIKLLSVYDLTAWNTEISTGAPEQPVRFTNCVIGKLILREPEESTGLRLELNNCWIGELQLPDSCLKGLTITGGGIAKIDCPPADDTNPFKGTVTFTNVFFPTSSRQTSLFEGAQAYRSLHSHLKKHDNMLMANLMRSCQLQAERSNEKGFAWFSNWFYGTFANYGTSPGRPIVCIIALYILSVAFLYHCDQGSLTQPPASYVGANESLLNEKGGRLNRSLRLPIQAMVNPFAMSFDARALIVPETTTAGVLLTVQGLFSDLLLIMTIFGIRRRFKAD